MLQAEKFNLGQKIIIIFCLFLLFAGIQRQGHQTPLQDHHTYMLQVEYITDFCESIATDASAFCSSSTKVRTIV